ncbi:hydantoinase/oxoprolinase family protein [Gordonia terrae]
MLTVDMDSGGTFTDVTLTRGEEAVSAKVPTTPHDLTICFRHALEVAAAAIDTDFFDLLRRIEVLRFSTTVGTNAVIERKGPRLGALVTADVLDSVSSLDPDVLPGALLPPGDSVVGVEPAADAGAVVAAVEKLLASGTERIVVGASGPGDVARTVETGLRDHITGAYPRHILGAVPVLLSTDVTEDDEFDRRFRSALVNAYVHPAIEQFFYEIEEIVRRGGGRRPILIFGNDGTSNRVASTYALRTLNSGPAGGVEAVTSLARHHRLEHAVGIDIGGTSSDVSFVVDGRAELDDRGRVADSTNEIELSAPMRRIRTFSGGGGTIARVRDGSTVVLGPDSAGSVPGPACFGFGGTDATVTDAAVVIGRLAPDSVLAGEITVDRTRAERAVEEQVGRVRNVDTVVAALEIVTTLERSLGESLAAEIAARGIDPKDVTLVAFGGAGPMHAAGIARWAGLVKVLVPSSAAVLSTIGIGASDVEQRYRRKVVAAEAARTAAEMADRARIDFAEQGFEDSDVASVWTISAFDGGGRQTAVVDSPVDLDATVSEAARVTIDLRMVGALPHRGFVATAAAGSAAESGRRPVVWDGSGPTDTPVFDAADLATHEGTVAGPLLVEGPTLSLSVPPGWSITPDRYGNHHLSFDSEDPRP